MNTRISVLIGILLTSLVLFSACGGGTEDTGITVYSGRSEKLVGPVLKKFTEDTGIQVRVKWGKTAAMAATILEEGKNTKADVFYAQDPAGLNAIQSMFAKLPSSTLNLAKPNFRSSDNSWVGISGRARVVGYNTSKVSVADLPDSIWDYTDPQWSGRIGWAPINGSFQAMVTGMRSLWGEAKTAQWLQGIQANNPKVLPNNTGILRALGAGEIDVGFTNHYYLFRFLKEEGDSFKARNDYLGNRDAGALLMVSGAGILDTSKNKDNATKFLNFLLSDWAQNYFTSTTFEYPVSTTGTIETHSILPPLESLNPPDISISDLSDLDGTLKLLQRLGIL